jgi:hypothetical protein
LLDGSRSFDPDGDELTFEWEVIAAPSDVEFLLTGLTEERAHLTPQAGGVWVVRLTVSDEHLAESQDLVVVRSRGCELDSECDDGNLCTDDLCRQSRCVFAFNSAPCDDGDPCTGNDACHEGFCIGGGDICGCVQDSDCAPFEDGDLCNGTLICVEDACEVDPGTVVSCDTSSDTDCRINLCRPRTGECHMTDQPDGTACEDGSLCTYDDFCMTGLCTGTAYLCDDGNFCTDDWCEPDLGCVISFNNAPCDDGNPCTEGDQCADGQCVSGNNTCQCQQDGDCLPFEDGDLCNGTLVCVANECQVDTSSIVSCDTSNDTECRKNQCQSATADCQMTDLPDGSACDDTDDCTTGDLCTAGACAGVLLDGDGDGYGPGNCGGDCNDSDPTINPGEAESCNGVDDNCDGVTDEGCICTPGELYCNPDGQTLHTCNSAGTGPDTNLDVVCGYICHQAACHNASNVGPNVTRNCNSSAFPLTPADGVAVWYTNVGILCGGDCGGGASLIPFHSVTPAGIAVSCVSTLDLPPSSTLSPDGSETRPLLLLVAGDATVAGSIRFNGGDGMDGLGFALPGGIGGPGGHNGAYGCLGNSQPGNPGLGDGGGQGGQRGAIFGGGGGGGAFGGNGGNGATDLLGGAGGNSHPPATLVPLTGGSGGGSGADGQTGNGCGPGGGGGGTFQVTARRTLTILGTLAASGGAGGSLTGNHGAGGGGSGGGILIEAPTITLNGSIEVNGGQGGYNYTNSDGGDGASGSNLHGSNAEFSIISGGGGGGGGGGRIRIKSLSQTPCTTVSPEPSCTSVPIN